MNSPPELNSPVSSRSQSPSPPNEKPSQKSQPAQLLNYISNNLGGSTASPSSSTKRRLPGGSTLSGFSSHRDTKSRRRDDRRHPGNAGQGGFGMMDKDTGGPKRDRDELVDHHLVDWLRKEIGDPFKQHLIKDSA